jgi:hypothetical protein
MHCSAFTHTCGTSALNALVAWHRAGSPPTMGTLGPLDAAQPQQQPQVPAKQVATQKPAGLDAELIEQLEGQPTCDLADTTQVVWAKVKGYPWWPVSCLCHQFAMCNRIIRHIAHVRQLHLSDLRGLLPPTGASPPSCRGTGAAGRRPPAEGPHCGCHVLWHSGAGMDVQQRRGGLGRGHDAEVLRQGEDSQVQPCPGSGTYCYEATFCSLPLKHRLHTHGKPAWEDSPQDPPHYCWLAPHPVHVSVGAQHPPTRHWQHWSAGRHTTTYCCFCFLTLQPCDPADLRA